MEHLFESVSAFMSDEEGAVMVEYILVIVFIALAAVAGMRIFATEVNQAFSTIGTKLTSDVDAAP